MSQPRGAATFHATAAAYDRHIGRYSGDLARSLVDTVGPRPGDRALDVGCGPGALTAELVRRLGADHVAAVDPSPSFVAACAQRLPGVDVRQAAAEALPFADGSVTHAFSQLVVNFMSDAPAGVAEMRRVAAPGGGIAAAVWDYAGEMTLLRTFWDAATALDPRAADADEGRAMGWCAPGPLRSLWERAGLEHVQVAPVVVAAAYDDLDDLWSGLEGGVGPAGAHVTSLAPAARAALKAEMHRRLGVGEEAFRLPARAWVVRGRVPR